MAPIPRPGSIESAEQGASKSRMKSSRLSGFALSAANTIGYVLAVLQLVIVDPLIESHARFSARTYPLSPGGHACYKAGAPPECPNCHRELLRSSPRLQQLEAELARFGEARNLAA